MFARVRFGNDVLLGYTLWLIRGSQGGSTGEVSLESAATTNDMDGRPDGHDRLARRAGFDSARRPQRRGFPLPRLRVRLLRRRDLLARLLLLYERPKDRLGREKWGKSPPLRHRGGAARASERGGDSGLLPQPSGERVLRFVMLGGRERTLHDAQLLPKTVRIIY